MKGYRVRHKDHSFNFAGKGKWYETKSSVEAKALYEKYPGCDLEVIDIVEEVAAEESAEAFIDEHALDHTGIEADEKAAEAKVDENTAEAVKALENEPEPAIRVAGGWYMFDGKRYRYKDLPDHIKAITPKK